MITTTGKLRERVRLERRQVTNPDTPDDFGNVVSDWLSRGEAWAEIKYLRGGETVLASRLEGRSVQLIRVRATSVTREITSDWRLIDMRSNAIFAVRVVNETPDRAWIELLTESGVAA
jgi:head-tail adaptor